MSDSRAHGFLCLAFGPAQSYAVVPRSDSFTSFWQGELAGWIFEGGRSVEYVAFSGIDGYYVRYEDGSSAWSLHPGLGKLIKKEGVKWIVFGPDSYVFLSKSGVLHWWNVPDALEERLESLSSSDHLVSVGLGQSSPYVAIFQTDYIWGGNVPDSLVQILHSRKISGSKSKVETLNPKP